MAETDAGHKLLQVWIDRILIKEAFRDSCGEGRAVEVETVFFELNALVNKSPARHLYREGLTDRPVLLWCKQQLLVGRPEPAAGESRRQVNAFRHLLLHVFQRSSRLGEI